MARSEMTVMETRFEMERWRWVLVRILTAAGFHLVRFPGGS
jgi:hypothetical protein